MDATPELAAADRGLLSDTSRTLRRVIGDRGAAEQLLHGDPHPGNVISTANGPLFTTSSQTGSEPEENS